MIVHDDYSRRIIPEQQLKVLLDESSERTPPRRDFDCNSCRAVPLKWRHNERDGVSNYRRLDYLLNRLFVEIQIKENIQAPRHWPLSEELTGNRWIPRTKG